MREGYYTLRWLHGNVYEVTVWGRIQVTSWTGMPAGHAIIDNLPYPMDLVVAAGAVGVESFISIPTGYKNLTISGSGIGSSSFDIALAGTGLGAQAAPTSCFAVNGANYPMIRFQASYLTEM